MYLVGINNVLRAVFTVRIYSTDTYQDHSVSFVSFGIIRMNPKHRYSYWNKPRSRAAMKVESV